ncbi:amidase [Litorimonas sp. WD9-15]|uniref:amidase n=1 Tax=Litorimonas sp. WD9-15 TaxID=3418716 RepID=UPI003D031DE8
MRLALTLAACCLATACAPTAEAPKTETVATTPDFTAKGMTARTLPELADALSSGKLSSEVLTQAYLDRIEAVDRNGPTLQSVLSLNPDALAQAKASDARRAAGESLGPLDGVPILFKDNIETLDPVATTAGAYALKDNITERDSPLVAGLRAEGAVILGKTNLSQWANFRSESSVSGWSALGGQVRNPHMLDRSPCGSSSGSGAAIAASLAAGAVGTETNGSIICPSNVNGIVGFKPTVGLVSQQHIVPISASQDTAGPMTKTVTGAAMMMDAMVLDYPIQDAFGYANRLDASSLNGKRVGVLRFAQGETVDIQDRFNAALKGLEAAGAELVEISEFNSGVENYGQKSYDVLLYEFKDGLNEYLANAAPAVTSRNLETLIAFNKTNESEMAVFDQSIFDKAQAKGELTEDTYITARDDVQRGTGVEGIDRLLRENDVDMLVSPSGPVASRIDPINGDVWPSWAGAGYLAAVAGYPHITVPMGDVHGIPIGLSIMGGAGQDAEILSYGYAFEQATNLRVDPQYLRNAEDRPELAKALSAK